MLEKYLPIEVSAAADKLPYVQEIRLRLDKDIAVLCKTGTVRLPIFANKQMIENCFSSLCSHSVYALQEEIKNGFLTLAGGHRAGLCGRCVVENGKIVRLCDITGINLRIAREVKGFAYPFFKSLNGKGENIVILSPPNCGKTTFLRDLARLYSDFGFKISVADERGEIAPISEGKEVFDIGQNTDVLRLCPKVSGMNMLLRTMNPDIIVTDEIGTDEDGRAILEILKCGVHIITTFHGFDLSDFKARFSNWHAFDTAVILNKEKEVSSWVHLK